MGYFRERKDMLFYFEDIKIRKRLLIEGGTFEIPNKGIVAIKGKNGVGKSLLLNYLYDEKINEGVRCAFVDQTSNRILENCTVYENIWDTVKNLEDEKVNQLLQHNINELSGGEKRLICLLRAILSDSDVLFIDEPTNELDYETVEKIHSLLEECKKTKLVILVTHDDRLDKIIDETLWIVDKRLKSESISIKDEICRHINEQDKAYEDEPKIKKEFCFGFFSLMSTIIIMVIVLYIGVKTLEVKENMLDCMPENEVDIFIPVSEYYNENMDSALPISYMPLFSESADLSKTVQKIAESSFDRKDVNFFLEIGSSENYNVNRLEYYNIESHENYILQKEIEELSNYSLEQLNFFIAQDSKALNAFSELAEKYEKEENFKLVCCSIMLKEGYSFSEFVSDTSLQEMMDGNYYVRSNEVIKVINNANILKAQKEGIFLLLGVMLIMLIFEMIFYYFYIISKSIVIRVYRNKGLKKQVIHGNIKKAINKKVNTIIYFILGGVVIGFQKYLMGLEMSLMWMIVVGYMILNSILVNLVLNKTIEKNLGWRFRC